MRLAFYPDRTILTVPELLFDVLDSYDAQFEAAFAKYTDPTMHVVAAWGTTGNQAGDPNAVLVVTRDHIITGYVELVYDDGDGPTEEDEWDEAEDGPWPGHKEPTSKERLTKMLALYRRRTRAPYLIVYDTPETEPWIEQGFTLAALPENVPSANGIHILTWGTLPEPLGDFLRQRNPPLVKDRRNHK